ncbi:hypothetical protein D9M69_577250 [compost metagenome]
MFEFRLDIDCNAVETDPATQPNADSCDLVFAHAAIGKWRLFRAHNPYANAICASFTPDVELRKRLDDPLFKRRYKCAHIFTASFEVEHDIGHALAGTMIGVFAATPGVKDWKTIRCQQIFCMGTRASRIKRRVLNEPDKLICRPFANGLNARFHEGKRLFIIGQTLSNQPFNCRSIRSQRQEMRSTGCCIARGG